MQIKHIHIWTITFNNNFLNEFRLIRAPNVKKLFLRLVGAFRILPAPVQDVLPNLLLRDVAEFLKVVPDPHDGALVQCYPVLLLPVLVPVTLV